MDRRNSSPIFISIDINYDETLSLCLSVSVSVSLSLSVSLCLLSLDDNFPRLLPQAFSLSFKVRNNTLPLDLDPEHKKVQYS